MSETVMMEAPAAGLLLFSDDMTQEREARLLEVGEYPDKGLTVTEADLDGIVARFSADGAPVKVEHTDTPLDPLGQVKRIWRDGGALMARLAFPEDLAAFLRRRGVQKLSVGLSRAAEGLGLAEVSLVLKPRIASAALFTGEEPTPSQAPTLPQREGKAVGGEGFVQRLEGGVTMAEDTRDAEIGRLRAELTAREVHGQIVQLKAEGRVVPASEGLARALLALPADNLITLSEGTTPEPAAAIFLRFLKAQPPVVRFTETAAAGGTGTDAEPVLTAEEAAWYRDTLGIDPDKVAAQVAKDNKN